MLRPLRILLAEDNLVNQRLAVGVLKKRGYTVVIAADGKRALAALERETFDLILMDVQMPEMGGFETTGRIREQEKNSDRRLPIIAMTAHAMKGDRERCLASGMDGYVSKPILAADLFQVIDETMGAWERDRFNAIKATDSRTEAESNGKAKAAFVLTEAMGNAGGDILLLREIAELFTQTGPATLDEIRKGLEQGDAASVQRAAHALKGSSSVFGAHPVADAAAKMEMMGACGDLSGAREALATLPAEMTRLLSALGTLG